MIQRHDDLQNNRLNVAFGEVTAITIIGEGEYSRAFDGRRGPFHFYDLLFFKRDDRPKSAGPVRISHNR